MLRPSDNERICRVGAGTPMGEVFRRYWLPVCVSTQIPKPDCDPLRVLLLGEQLVVFRDTNGKVGVLDELCPHRGASLALGRVEECGIRCLYHGWKFAVDGTILDTPNNRDESFKKRVKATAYPVREEGGMVWAYLGAAAKMPAFTRYAFMDAADENRTILRVNVKANYLQLLEGGHPAQQRGPSRLDRQRRDAEHRRDQSGQSRGRRQCADSRSGKFGLWLLLRGLQAERWRGPRDQRARGAVHHALDPHHSGSLSTLHRVRNAGRRREHQHLHRHPWQGARRPREGEGAAGTRRSALLVRRRLRFQADL